MSRSVSQLLFTYLPGKVVDWEDGMAIVQLRDVRLTHAWTDQQAQLVLEEVQRYLDSWRERGGSVHPQFPNPRIEPGRFVVGEPESITAVPLEGALICLRCGRLAFRSHRQLAKTRGPGIECPNCKNRTLRQFGQVFVHGCGRLETLQKYLPWMSRNDDGKLRVSQRPVRCPKCNSDAALAIPARSERARDMAIVCQACDGFTAIERLVARCPDCARQLTGEPRRDEQDDREQPTAVGQVAMRLTNSRATDAYYAHTLTILRLDRPRILTEEDPEIRTLTNLLPEERRPRSGVSSQVSSLQELTTQLAAAELRGDASGAQRLRDAIVAAARAPASPAESDSTETQDGQVSLIADVVQSIEESLAFRTSVKSRPVREILLNCSGATSLFQEEIANLSNRLGLNRIRMVEDLPVISTSFGFTRRSFEPTYDEEALNAHGLPTQIRPFYAFGRSAARRIDRSDLVGAVPVLAREGEHEGIFLSLDPERVIKWLEANNVQYSGDGASSLIELLQQLEPVDRYYDGIHKLPLRRMVFGLVHSLSHAAMRVISRLAGLERTSLSEYIFLPLLGTVIYANGNTTKLGAMETVIQTRMLEFLEALSNEACDCLYDPICIDHRGACHGCLHAPEISCRVFNHGLSRAFLVGGHRPWLDASDETSLTGFWE